MSDGEEWKGEDERPSGMMFSLWGRSMTPEQEAAYKVQLADRRAKGRMLAATLTTYREDAGCPKCGAQKARTAFCDGASHGGCMDHAGDTEHMHRTCKRCSYTWYERPLDAESHS